ncbi:NADPH-dependent FMN reductase [Gordonia hydrophobica]|uniref:NAD(P)H-dependent oxidoreductase n=1 Tax=Gordonia hydrophobica TaxID=40516 RepID=A0ABZ2TX80_9ACTN|nr:NAD(P)H-dependent oxidoreductase [Gordonia hydrophobica]MBM7366293.1 NAD(P)H-dependent FMN reductase [Gordonia hydrophobica]
MPRIAIIVGSTRPGRISPKVAQWVHTVASSRDDAEFEILDLADFTLPIYDEPLPPSMGQYTHDHTRVWSAAIAGFDGFVFVTPEYNRSIPGVLKNAIDYLSAEWANKAAGFVGYGVVGGARALEHLRLVLGELRVAPVRDAVCLSLFDDFTDFTDLTPREVQVTALETMLDDVVAWSRALASLRTPQHAETAV